MGGISTYALFNQYPDITAAAGLMGNTDPARLLNGLNFIGLSDRSYTETM